jgi:hypothetical protein
LPPQADAKSLILYEGDGIASEMVKEAAKEAKSIYMTIIKRDIAARLKYYNLCEDFLHEVRKDVIALRILWCRVRNYNGADDAEDKPKLPFWCPLSLLQSVGEKSKKRKSLNDKDLI